MKVAKKALDDIYIDHDLDYLKNKTHTNYYLETNIEHIIKFRNV